ncbi:hypothetical protein WJT86_00815 [Microvirga sp. W0021]|uniref:Barstar (barnase inhibitor) domain-containing protein n=1 Tax=Hohaiivirga grylli TaxID=3133970 RepID=A0ABV0BF51_9HYPH
MKYFQISDKNNHCLSFDLKELLEVLSDHGLEADWIVSDADEELDIMGNSRIEFDQLALTGTRIKGVQLMELAQNTTQVIWGQFTSFLPIFPKRPWVILKAFDSSFWEVATSDSNVINALKGRFEDIKEVPEFWINPV